MAQSRELFFTLKQLRPPGQQNSYIGIDQESCHPWQDFKPPVLSSMEEHQDKSATDISEMVLAKHLIDLTMRKQL
eukprot:scaffold12414_cov84-Cyclotella_meneghiniana.AAC.2